MKAKKYIFTIFVTGIIVALFCAIFHPFEPRYQGRRLSQWADILSLASDSPLNGETAEEAAGQRGEATNAIRHIGIRALPYAIQWCQVPEPAREGNLPDWIETEIDFLDEFKQRIGIPPSITRYDLRERSVGIFYSLGPEAKPAIPILIGLLENKDLSIANTASADLCCIGPAVAAPLMVALTNGSIQVRRCAANIFCLIDQIPTSSIPALTVCLSDQDFEVRQFAARSLSKGGTNAPSTVVPALLAALKNETDPQQKAPFIRALGRFGTNAQIAEPVLKDILKKPLAKFSGQQMNWAAAMNALNSIDPDAAKPFVEEWNTNNPQNTVTNSHILRDPHRARSNSTN